MPGFKSKCAQLPFTVGLFAFLLLLFLTAVTGSQAASNASPSQGRLPAVEDEPGQSPPPKIDSALTAAASSRLQTNLSALRSLAQAREEIRRAFVSQNYERVLSLSQEMQQQFSVNDSNNFYAVAAQIRLTERKELEEGKR